MRRKDAFDQSKRCRITLREEGKPDEVCYDYLDTSNPHGLQAYNDLFLVGKEKVVIEMGGCSLTIERKHSL